MDFKKKIKEFFSDKYNCLTVGVIIFAILLRLFYINTNKALWWDEAQFLLQARHYAFGTINSGWWAGKGIAFPVILAVLFKLLGGVNLWAARFLEILFSAGTLLLTYFIGSKFFGKKVAVISIAFLSVLWMDIFYSAKILSDIPSVFFTILAFWLLVKNEKPNMYELLFSGASLIFAGMIKFNAWLMGIPFLLYLVWFERKKVKWFLIGGILFFAIYCLMSFALYGNPLYEPMDYVSINVGGVSNIDALYYFGSIVSIFSMPVVICFVLSILTGWRKKKNLFLLFSILFLILIMSIANYFDYRYIYYIFPFFCIVAALGLDLSIKKIKLEKFFWVIFLVVFIIATGLNIHTAHTQTVGRQHSYYELKQASDWLKYNAEPTDVIMTVSTSQVTFYSEMKTIEIPPENEFYNVLEKENPRYLIVSGYEKHPDYIFNLLQDNSTFIPRKDFNLFGTDQPIVAIFEIISSPN